MENDEPGDQSTEDSQQTDEQPISGGQSQDSQPIDQSDQTTAETSQLDQQPTGEQVAAEQSSAEDQAGDQRQDQATDTEQTADQSGDSDQSSTSTDSEDAVALGGASGGTPKTSARKVKVIAEFTEEGGSKFYGDIRIGVLEYDEQGVSTPKWELGDWQAGSQKGNVITTPMVRVTTSQVAVMANVRALLANGGYQMMSGEFVFAMPSSDTLRAKFNVEVKPIDQTVTAADATQAKAIVSQPPLLRGQVVFQLDAQPVGNQQFHVTGKYYSGKITSPDGRAL